MKSKKCSTCRRKLKIRNFTYLYEQPSAFQASYVKHSQFCHDCQSNRAKRPTHEMQPYINRDYILRSMGYESYREYLASDQWKAIRLRVLKRDNFRCRVCGERATQVHHNLYRKKELCGQSLKGMRAMCDEHHRQVEFDESRKVGLVEASHRYVAIKTCYPFLPP